MKLEIGLTRPAGPA